MERYGVTSSNIAAIGWEPDEEGSVEGIMEVEFNGGQVYQYRAIPAWLFRELLHAPSPGRFFRANIASSYQGDRIE
ncbi:MAG TPA: KTSC domain-containing protein [Candidatus Methylomirabilis sp.]|nr:KTSC domain-containing protein [Candidatus Methylomirabilis sp.]